MQTIYAAIVHLVESMSFKNDFFFIQSVQIFIVFETWGLRITRFEFIISVLQ